MAKKHFIDLSGQKFGHLSVLEYSYTDKFGKSIFKCVCDCGFIILVIGANLKAGKTKTCNRSNDCEYAFEIKKGTVIHGLSHIREYPLWLDIKQRCYNPNNTNYYLYGARGITMYEPWINSFQAFYDYLQTLPETREQFEVRTGEKGTLDRIENNNGYVPDNLRWLSTHEQSQNRRNNVLNKQLVKYILWEYEINKKSPLEIYDLIYQDIKSTGYESGILRIKNVCDKVEWSNIDIKSEIAEYERFGTINGIEFQLSV